MTEPKFRRFPLLLAIRRPSPGSCGAHRSAAPYWRRWARRAEAAHATAAPYGADVAGSFEELLDRARRWRSPCRPPCRPSRRPWPRGGARRCCWRSRSGRTWTRPGASRTRWPTREWVSQLVLTKRYHPVTRAFLAAARDAEVSGARSCCLHGAFRSGEFATGWRLEQGELLDLGPHLLDLLDAAVGPVKAIRGTGDSPTWLELTCEHENGAVSQASPSGAVNVDRAVTRVELFGAGEPLVYDTAENDHEECRPVPGVRDGGAHRRHDRPGRGTRSVPPGADRAGGVTARHPPARRRGRARTAGAPPVVYRRRLRTPRASAGASRAAGSGRCSRPGSAGGSPGAPARPPRSPRPGSPR